MYAKQTPGPWTVSSEPYKPSSSPMLAVENDDLIVAFVFTDAPDDARLIAAAPDLLEALRDLVHVMATKYEDYRPALARAADAICKAEGIKI